MRIHLIAIGGAVMHNLALELAHIGHLVSGSDDDIFEPSRGRLAAAGLLPDKMGWDPQRITNDVELVLLGMHARSDNPELLRALESGIPVMSFPEFIFNQSRSKKRLVVCGSHGKTTTTAMIMHVLKQTGMPFDYLVGSKLEGFDRMVQLSDAPLIVIEGDEYLSSALDPRPKFLWYDPDVAIITGIAWDHVNVFPTYEKYVEQFESLIGTLRPESHLIWYEGDADLKRIAGRSTCVSMPYAGLSAEQVAGDWFIRHLGGVFPMRIFGKHNFQNMDAAVKALETIGVDPETSLNALGSFAGTARRMELVHDERELKIYRDFAHSPSKVIATVEAVREGFPDFQFVAVLELHTFSSLSREFLPLYTRSMDPADEAFVFYSPENLTKKNREPFSPADVKSAFGNVRVYTEMEELVSSISEVVHKPTVVLLMSSGSFEGVDLASEISSAHSA